MVQTFLKQIRLRYKATRFPWKKHALVGYDLAGNEYWDMPNPNNPGRYKRWVQMKDPSSQSIFEENKLPVQWQGWLRHTRSDPPSIEELLREQQRRLYLDKRVRELRLEQEQQRIRKLEQAKDADVEKPAVSAEPSTKPEGHGDNFKPGAWSPNISRR